MCGITFIQSQSSIVPIIDTVFNKLYHRGPDDESYVTLQDDKVFLGFNRLIINDDSSEAMQPFEDNGVWVICNGEIFNWKKIVEKFNLHMKTSCDCEVILRLYQHLANIHGQDFKQIGIDLSNELDGEFAFVIYIEEFNTSIASRDPYGVRPLFYGVSDAGLYSFCSEMKGIHDICSGIEQFRPGHIMINGKEYHPYTTLHDIQQLDLPEEDILKMIRATFKEAVRKRLMSDKEICCLLSGGLDSSLVAGLVSQHFEPYTLKTYSIGLKGSTDLEYAQKVAEHIKSTHTNIELSEQAFLDAIDVVIKTIESYDTTTVRASVGNYLVAKYIKENSDCKVVFNGDYSDEVCGGYKYMSLCEDESEFHNECVRLVESIQWFDSLRSDRCISSQGLEARVPFADKDFVRLYKSIPVKMRMSNGRMEKYMLRKAFDEDNIIPHDVLWRKKEAFSDGVSSKENSWHTILKNYIEDQLSDIEYEEIKLDSINPPVLKETAYYKKIFKQHFKFENIIPYYWLPKYCGDVSDPSARELLTLAQE
jgi:asparagine synthase (glutamine-hydrolysing)